MGTNYTKHRFVHHVGKFVITMIAGHIFCILKKHDCFLESINCFPCVYGLGTNKSVSSYVWDNSLCKCFFESDAINGFFYVNCGTVWKGVLIFITWNCI